MVFKGVTYWDLLKENTTLNVHNYRTQLEKLESVAFLQVCLQVCVNKYLKHAVLTIAC